MAETNSLLLKLRPSGALWAAESRANLQPLYDTTRAAASALGVEAEPHWFLAELPDGAATLGDLAHTRVAGQFGISESDVIFA